MKNAMLVILLLGLCQQVITAQVTDTSNREQKKYKNTVRFNLTNPFIFGTRSLIFGYERQLGRNRSFSVNIGQASFPDLSLLSSDSLKTASKKDEKGINFSADYRFYLMKENKFEKPRGIYIGPYYAFNFFERKQGWSLLSTNGGNAQNVESKTSLTVHTVGFELGYQFLLWNRISLDMLLFGPGISAYNLKASLANNLSEADRQKFFDSLNQALAEKFPGYSEVIDDGEFKKKGSSNTTSFGFRYMVMLGYRF
jgi:hypothetical protein